MSETLVRILNRHTPACGTPPIFESSSDCYVGYFQNAYGEQWVFTYDNASREAVLHGGDLGWNTEAKVIDGMVPELVLGNPEQLWLRACWSAAVKK